MSIQPKDLTTALLSSPIGYSSFSGYYVTVEGRSLSFKAALEALQSSDMPKKMGEVQRVDQAIQRIKQTLATPGFFAYFRGDRLADLQGILTTLDQRVDAAFQTLFLQGCLKVRNSLHARQVNHFIKTIAILKFQKAAARQKAMQKVAHFTKTKTRLKIQEKKEAAVLKIDSLKKQFQQKLQQKREINLKALKIQRAFIQHLQRRAKAGEKIRCMKVEYPLMASIRKGSIQEHHKGAFDGIFYRYMGYARSSGDIEGLQRLAYAMFSVLGGKWRNNETLFLGNLFALKREDRATTVALLMTSLKKNLEEVLDAESTIQSMQWMRETGLANFDHPKGKKREKYGYKDGAWSKQLVDCEDEDFSSWANHMGRDPEKNTTIVHSGGYYSIKDFFGGIYHGYPLEGLRAAGNTYGYGIQVHPDGVGPAKREFYAYSRAPSYFDLPATLDATVKAKYLQQATNHYEAGLRGEDAKQVSNVRIRLYPNKDTLPFLTWDSRAFITPGAEARYTAHYGENSLWAKLQVASN